MIQSFADKHTEELFVYGRSRRYPADIVTRALRKLRLIDAVETLEELKIPPDNRPEALGGDRAGQHSIRINNQWRICFEWKDDGAHNVEINNHYAR